MHPCPGIPGTCIVCPFCPFIDLLVLDSLALDNLVLDILVLDSLVLGNLDMHYLRHMQTIGFLTTLGSCYSFLDPLNYLS